MPAGCGPCGLVRLGATYTFCFLCFVGAVSALMLGAVGWRSVEHRDRRTGTCLIADPAAFACECAEWSGTGAGYMCDALEASVGGVTFTPDADQRALHPGGHAPVTCALKAGAGSLETCLQSFFTLGGIAVSAARTVPCRLHDDTRNCFPEDLSISDKGERGYLYLTIGAAVWAGVLLLCTVLLCVREAASKRAQRHELLADDEAAMGDAGDDLVANCGAAVPGLFKSGVYMNGDRVSARIKGVWEYGVVIERVGARAYAVKLEAGGGDRRYTVPVRHLRSGSFTEGAWVCAQEDVTVPGGEGGAPHVVQRGVVGVSHRVREDGTPEVTMGGRIFTAKAGDVTPTPSVRRGHVVEVSRDGREWEEAVVRALHTQGTVLAVRRRPQQQQPGGGGGGGGGGGDSSDSSNASATVAEDAKPFHWVRRLCGVRVETLAEQTGVGEKEAATFVFVDPDQGRAPTVMTREQVELYGGVRNVSHELAEFRAAPAAKLALATGLLSSSALVAKHLEREARRDEGREEALRLRPPPGPEKASASPASPAGEGPGAAGGGRGGGGGGGGGGAGGGGAGGGGGGYFVSGHGSPMPSRAQSMVSQSIPFPQGGREPF